MTTIETLGERFQRWADRLRTICNMPDDQQKEAERLWASALNEMWAEDRRLGVYTENCVDGCCPGDFVLVRTNHPDLDAAWMVIIFPDMIKSYQTHRAVLREAGGK
jgi:hypothetical protein